MALHFAFSRFCFSLIFPVDSKLLNKSGLNGILNFIPLPNLFHSLPLSLSLSELHMYDVVSSSVFQIVKQKKAQKVTLGRNGKRSCV